MKPKIAVRMILTCILLSSCSHQTRARELTLEEAKIQGFVHELYGGKMISESIVFHGDDAVMCFTADGFKNLDVNLSSLARKQHEEGLSDAVVKLSLRF